MKISIWLFMVFMSISTVIKAGGAFETTDEARQRHSAERYDAYKNNNYQAPLGGYDNKLGDPAPLGTDKPGYNTPQGSNSLYINNSNKSNGSDW